MCNSTWHNFLSFLPAISDTLTLSVIYKIFLYCSDRSDGSGADFVAGFVIGGAVFGTLAYIFAPQVTFNIFCATF